MHIPLEEQRMADLPAELVEPSPPFSYTGIDCFGPYYTKNMVGENQGDMVFSAHVLAPEPFT